MSGEKYQVVWKLSVTVLTFFSWPLMGHSQDVSELFLTPLIRKGEFDKAKSAALDNFKSANIQSAVPVQSYSGYLTVDEKFKSNLFFYFFPAMNNPESAPLVLWVNDIPGHTSLRNVFTETGPFYVNENNELKEREAAWTKTHSVLYLDAPVGAGFSFTENADGYARDSKDEANEVYEALLQFFKLFPEFVSRDFYMAGEAYAGTFIPHIAFKIDEGNTKGKSGVKINLKGAIIGSPFADVQTQVVHADFWHEVGLVTQAQAKEMQKEQKKIMDLAKANKPNDALKVAVNLILSPDSMLFKATGIQNPRNIMHDKDSLDLQRYVKFVDTKEMHNYLHVGLHKFEFVNEKAFQYMSKDYFQANPKMLETMLNKGYKVLLFACQFDGLTPPTGVEKMVHALKWKGSKDFSKAPRKIWNVGNHVAGYSQKSSNLNFVFLRNAGGFPFMDQPAWTLDMLERFTGDKDF